MFSSFLQVCEFLSIIAEINLAIEENNSNQVYTLATSSDFLEDLHENNMKKYMAEMQIERQRKILNHGDIQEIIDNVNSNHQSNYLQIEALQNINEAVEKCDAPKLRCVHYKIINLYFLMSYVISIKSKNAEKNSIHCQTNCPFFL